MRHQWVCCQELKLTEDNQKKQAALSQQADRRRILKLGAAGLPMMMTVPVGAQSLLVSQLQCLLDIPSNWLILVDKKGRAWMTRYGSYFGGPLSNYKIQLIKWYADFSFPKRTVPTSFRPSKQDCKKDDDGQQSYNSHESSNGNDPTALMSNFQWADSLASSGGPVAYNSNVAGQKFASADDQSANPSHNWGWDWGWGAHDQYCADYKTYLTSGTTTGVSDFVDENGNWTLSNDGDGLYVHLARQYLMTHGVSGGWPGISCLHSVLNYFNQL